MNKNSSQADPATRHNSQPRNIPFNHGWLFGGAAVNRSSKPEFDDSGFERVTLPHSNESFSWCDIDRSKYQYISIYRRHFSLPPELRRERVFIDFEGVMRTATVFINGERLGEYKGGYTPFSFELTPHLNWDGENILAVKVDSRRSRYDVPPFADGPEIDFDTFGGIYRSAWLRVVPETFVENVFAKPTNVMDDDRSLDITCYINNQLDDDDTIIVEAELHDDGQPFAKASTEVSPNEQVVELSMNTLEETELWDINNPKLYDVKVHLRKEDRSLHKYNARVGFREARFEQDGFYLNGRRLNLFGLNRHQLFPYVGPAMPARIQRRDAEILKNELNCNIVRTSHYVQSPAFLDACDELGLLVWNEMPGWQCFGNATWQDTSIEHVQKMIRRDWNRPSVVLWGVRINEGESQTAEFEDHLNDLTHKIDDSRQTTGAYRNEERNKPLRQDVRGQNDYGYPNEDENLPIYPSNYREPYLTSEAVGQKVPGGSFTNYYGRTETMMTQQDQARRHAHAHNIGASDIRHSGVIAWCAFEYNSPYNALQEVKTPGVCDIFRVPKLGANFYRSQVDPREKIVLEPAFYWDFGPNSPPNGPGKNAMIYSNCKQLEISVDGKHIATLQPDLENFPYLHYPPFTVNLSVDGSDKPVLRIDGLIDDQKVISRRFSADTENDQLLLQPDDDEIIGDGIDMTRLVFRAVDRYGAPRPFVEDSVDLELEGPGEIVGDSSFQFEDAGGVGAVWIRADEGQSGQIQVRAEHSRLGTQVTEIDIQKEKWRGR